MNIKYKPNYSGYIPLPRNIQYLVRDGGVTLELLGLYLVLVMQADFDKRHANYGVVLRDDRQISELTNLSISTISRWKRKLTNLGLLSREGMLTRITNFTVFENENINTVIKLSAQQLINELITIAPLSNEIANKTEL